ncbi:MAG: hypothetical protein K8R21_07405, partial [Leptospira sp.]|nr:hypothetical protein [Leptospira sp.]
MNHSIAIIFTMLTFSFQLFAETIIFKTGKSIEGKIVKQSPDSIRVLTGNKETNIPKKQIFKVLYNASAQQKKQLEAQALEASKKEKAVSPEELRALELERIVALEKELEKLNLEKTQTAPRTDEELREKISQLEKRIQDMEKFVEMKSDWKEYYTRKRSPLDLIWRSAIIPGWGQIYAKEGFPGGLYTTLFIMGIVAGEGLSVAHDNANQALQKKIFNTFVTQPVVLNSILTGPAASVSGTSSLIFYQTYTNYNSVLHAMHDA